MVSELGFILGRPALTHRPVPCQRCVNWFYNLQIRGACQTPRKSHKDIGIVGWIVG